MRTRAIMAASRGLRCWGTNSEGTLGIGSDANIATPPSRDVPIMASAVTDEGDTLVNSTRSGSAGRGDAKAVTGYSALDSPTGRALLVACACCAVMLAARARDLWLGRRAPHTASPLQS